MVILLLSLISFNFKVRPNKFSSSHQSAVFKIYKVTLLKFYQDAKLMAWQIKQIKQHLSLHKSTTKIKTLIKTLFWII